MFKDNKIKRILLSIILISIVFNCTKKDWKYYPKASIVIGKVELIRNNQTSLLENDQYVRCGDTIRVSEDAKLKMEFWQEGTWYLGKGAELVFGEIIAISENKRRLNTILNKGELFIVKRNENLEEYSIKTKQWVFRITSADIAINYRKNEDICMVSLLQGFATFMPQGGNETIIPSCTRLQSTSSGPGELQPIDINEIEQLKTWVGNSVISEGLNLSGCTLDELKPESEIEVNNGIPEWKSMLDKEVLINSKVTDTLLAIDPEQQEIEYEIIKGFKGMVIDKKTGIITYIAKPAGLNTMMFAAMDSDGNRCTTTVNILVKVGVTIRLLAPKIVEPDEKVTIIAKIKGVNLSDIVYRFDIDGDGKFEIPAKGRYGKLNSVKNHSYSKEGIYTIAVEAKTNDGKYYKRRRKITVNRAPTVVFNITPQFASVGMPVTFDLTSSTDTRNGNVPLKVAFDLNNDGIYEISEKINELKYIHQFESPGIYTVTAACTDMDGITSTVSKNITIGSGLSGGLIVGPDTVCVNKKTDFKCNIENPEYPISGFAWDTIGKGIYGKYDTVHMKTIVFEHEGAFTISCKVIDKKNQVLTCSKKIVVINEAASVSAGGPYTGAVNTKIIFNAEATDNDNKIKSISWDVDGDGEEDWKSEKVEVFNFIYKKSGTYKAILTAVTDDGKAVSDTATVIISNHSPKAFAGNDIVSRKNKKITLNGTGKDEDGAIASYEWDFNGDGIYDWSSKDTGVVTYAFKSYSYAVLKVTDGDGAFGLDTVKIIICPNGMKMIKKGNFCIDKYEFPNKKGALPKVDVSYNDAAQLCNKSGKRLCTAYEWEIACRDKKKKKNYPYGRKYAEQRCNTMGNPRLKNTVAPSGDFFECRNSNGIYDMSGNVAEWTQKVGGHYYVYGGSYQNGEIGSSCNSKVSLEPNKKYFFVGFRCCK